MYNSTDHPSTSSSTEGHLPPPFGPPTPPPGLSSYYTQQQSPSAAPRTSHASNYTNSHISNNKNNIGIFDNRSTHSGSSRNGVETFIPFASSSSSSGGGYPLSVAGGIPPSITASGGGSSTLRGGLSMLSTFDYRSVSSSSMEGSGGRSLVPSASHVTGLQFASPGLGNGYNTTNHTSNNNNAFVDNHHFDSGLRMGSNNSNNVGGFIANLNQNYQGIEGDGRSQQKARSNKNNNKGRGGSVGGSGGGGGQQLVQVGGMMNQFHQGDYSRQYNNNSSNIGHYGNIEYPPEHQQHLEEHQYHHQHLQHSDPPFPLHQQQTHRQTYQYQQHVDAPRGNVTSMQHADNDNFQSPLPASSIPYNNTYQQQQDTYQHKQDSSRYSTVFSNISAPISTTAAIITGSSSSSLRNDNNNNNNNNHHHHQTVGQVTDPQIRSHTQQQTYQHPSPVPRLPFHSQQHHPHEFRPQQYSQKPPHQQSQADTFFPSASPHQQPYQQPQQQQHHDYGHGHRADRHVPEYPEFSTATNSVVSSSTNNHYHHRGGGGGGGGGRQFLSSASSPSAFSTPASSVITSSMNNMNNNSVHGNNNYNYGNNNNHHHNHNNHSNLGGVGAGAKDVPSGLIAPVDVQSRFGSTQWQLLRILLLRRYSKITGRPEDGLLTATNVAKAASYFDVPTQVNSIISRPRQRGQAASPVSAAICASLRSNLSSSVSVLLHGGNAYRNMSYAASLALAQGKLEWCDPGAVPIVIPAEDLAAIDSAHQQSRLQEDSLGWWSPEVPKTLGHEDSVGTKATASAEGKAHITNSSDPAPVTPQTIPASNTSSDASNSTAPVPPLPSTTGIDSSVSPGTAREAAATSIAVLAAELVTIRRFKTKLCHSWLRTGGKCARGSSCDYAHGAHELRSSLEPHKQGKYKQRLCGVWLETAGVFCPHADRCSFAHGAQELRIRLPGSETSHHVSGGDEDEFTHGLHNDSYDHHQYGSGGIEDVDGIAREDGGVGGFGAGTNNHHRVGDGGAGSLSAIEPGGPKYKPSLCRAWLTGAAQEAVVVALKVMTPILDADGVSPTTTPTSATSALATTITSYHGSTAAGGNNNTSGAFNPTQQTYMASIRAAGDRKCPAGGASRCTYAHGLAELRLPSSDEVGYHTVSLLSEHDGGMSAGVATASAYYNRMSNNTTGADAGQLYLTSLVDSPIITPRDHILLFLASTLIAGALPSHLFARLRDAAAAPAPVMTSTGGSAGGLSSIPLPSSSSSLSSSSLGPFSGGSTATARTTPPPPPIPLADLPPSFGKAMLCAAKSPLLRVVIPVVTGGANHHDGNSGAGGNKGGYNNSNNRHDIRGLGSLSRIITVVGHDAADMAVLGAAVAIGLVVVNFPAVLIAHESQ